MIENQTVFVLGAGANCSYGFPSGEKLKQDIITAVDRSTRGDGQRSFLRLINCGLAKPADVQPDRCQAFMHALSNAGQPSIDAFMNANRHQAGFQEIGKGAIAQALLDYEASASTESQDDWLDYVFRVMLDGVNTVDQFISKNRVAFITFNYDRFLESWLLKRIQHSFGLTETDSLNALKEIPIHHVYGALGSFPDANSGDPRAWIKASTGIRTIFDAEHDQETLDLSKALLSEAQVICLLGFGYHRENIELLGLIEHITNCQGVVASTRYDITAVEWARFSKPFPLGKISAAHDSYKCLAALRNMNVF